ncbi:MAG: histidine kinase [Lachnospiraceae bacterium]|nr:histidine kinase [Lachnospiraceae bacterium]
MKISGILKRFLWAMFGLSVCLVLLWVTFYFLTLDVIRRNLKLQAETASEAIIAGVEGNLLSLEDAAYDLGHDSGVIRMALAGDAVSFYRAGGELMRENGALRSGFRDIDNVIVFRSEDQFYRLKGTVSNTTLRRLFYMIENQESRIITVTSNDRTYIGLCGEIIDGGKTVGHVALLQEQARIERLLGTYNDLDYLGVALLSGDRVLSSNKEIRTVEVERIREQAVFVREREIGISGYRLLVWCEDSIAAWLSGYFRLAMPVTVAVLVLIMLFFIRYLRRHMVEPIELEKERTLLTLLKKQIGAHFTVNSLNVIRALINKGEKEEAAHICDELSVLLRYANAGDEYITLLREFFVLEQYVGIMQIRYPDRIEAQIEVDDAFAEIQIPRMLIQPLVENAIVHGLSDGSGIIRLWADIEEQAVIVHVSDNGRGMDSEKLERLREMIRCADTAENGELQHVALQNIERRIRLVCGPAYGLSISSAPGEGTEVSVRLPRTEASEK